MNIEQMEIGKYQINWMLSISTRCFEMKMINKIIISYFSENRTGLNLLNR